VALETTAEVALLKRIVRRMSSVQQREAICGGVSVK
jgi:hypothetical protein